jgi:allophanate hydrolase
MLIGKTNMDQFATGLVGTRSPYGACHNVYNNAYISGGSSSGSAVATVRGHVAFALGTDTAGSGRVPAAFNGLVGYKPTRGVLSTDGVVPACASLDCVSVFAQDCRDALQVSRVAAGFDPADPYSRREADTLDLDPNLDVDPEFSSLKDSTLGVPAPPDQEFFGDEEAASLFDTTVETLAEIGTVTHVDMEPFYETAALLYGGPWIAERFAAVGEFIEENPDAVDPVVEEIICDRTSYSAVETFEAFQRLKSLTRRADGVMADIDALVVPTTGMTYTIESVRDAPVELNSNLGYYTNFVNLLDLSAVAVPTGQFDAGPTFGVTVIGDAFADATVTAIAAELRAAVTTDQPEPPSPQ